MPTTRRRITLSGVKPIRQQRPAYQSYYLYGAVERFWQDLKSYLAFDLHETLPELKERVSEKLHSYTDEAVASLTGYEYLLDAARA
ncbi:hypothetical protein GGP96_002043 [Salinibacter ruber]|uniref:hypothetical protein n=1 Tax=Salinibacter ruber TaxID=146919 RepID=UPI002169158B|nr:hypothetical protein [Salinibacter ruber]MCS4177318.1 hypothetical protein [Salinibacter ruber]